VSAAAWDGVHNAFFFTSLDVRTGELVKYDGPDPIPAHLAGGLSGTLAGGTSPDGTFLVIYWHAAEGTWDEPEVFYALGELGDPRTMDLGKLLPKTTCRRGSPGMARRFRCTARAGARCR
jgi:hypothetical protein